MKRPTVHRLPVMHQRGIALLVTLSMLVIATILILGFIVSMRTDRIAVKSLANNERAKLVAQSALQHAIALLNKNIPQPVPPGASGSNPTNWIINPGLLTLVTGNNRTNVRQIPLSSNPSADYRSQPDDPNLNQPALSGNGTYAILPTAEPMRVAWVNVLQDPTQAASSNNPMIGRYAFWMDDENSKINLNTATTGKPSGLVISPTLNPIIQVANRSYPVGHPFSVNAGVLGGELNTQALAARVYDKAPLATTEDVKEFIPLVKSDSFYQRNKFNISVNDYAPEFTVFGKSRFYLLNRFDSGTLGTDINQFYRDVEAPMYFHGTSNGNNPASPGQYPDKHALYYSAAAISKILDRNDWPGMPRKSFVDKWGGDELARLEADQVAWNILSLGYFTAQNPYQNTSTPTVSQYFRLINYIPQGDIGAPPSVNEPNNLLQLGYLSNKVILPVLPRPMVNEVCLEITPEAIPSTTPTRYWLKMSCTYELWLPPGYPTTNQDSTSQFNSSRIYPTYIFYNITDTVTTATQSCLYYPTGGTASDVFWASYGTTAAANSTDINSPTFMKSGSFRLLPTTKPFYASSNAGAWLTAGTSAKQFSGSGNPISVTLRMRLVHTNANNGAASQIIPIWDALQC
jgi:hypothetical protein